MQLEQIMGKEIQKNLNTQLLLLKSWEQKQGTPHAKAPPKGLAGHLSHPSGSTPGLIPPTLAPYKEPAPPAPTRLKQTLIYFLRVLPLLDTSQKQTYMICSLSRLDSFT